MCRPDNKSTVSLFLTLLMITFNHQASATNAIYNFETTSADGDYFLVDNFQNDISGGDFGAFAGGDSIDTSLVPTMDNVSGLVGGDLFLSNSFDDHRYTGFANAAAEVLDPNNQLSLVQADGETMLDFNFTLLSAHTYSLTGSIFTENKGRVSISFDSKSISEADTTFNLTGLLAAGDYIFNSNNIAALSEAGITRSNFEFELVLSEVTPVPLPATFWLLLSGLLTLYRLSFSNRAFNIAHLN